MDKKQRVRVLTSVRVRKYRAVKKFMYNSNNVHSQCKQLSTSATNQSRDHDDNDFNHNGNQTDENNSESSFVCNYELEESGGSASSDTSHEEPINEPINPEVFELRTWAIANDIRQQHLDQLLLILRRRLLPELPKSSKTFLRTCVGDYTIHKRVNPDGFEMEYVYFGLEKGLRACLNKDLHTSEDVELQIHVDGLPLFASSSKQLWPILCKVHFRNDVYRPFPVAIYSGDKKPSNVDDVLTDFVEEINILLQNGITIGDTTLGIRLKCFICDTPARAFVKCVKGHGGYGACERCTIHGIKIGYTTVYPSTEYPLRTNSSFRSQEDGAHHVGISTLLQIQPKIDLIATFVLDFMHLCCLGVMKKLFAYWLDTTFETCLGPTNKAKLDQRLREICKGIPVEFQRKLRSLSLITKWKATEYRLFLLYVGPVVLRDILHKKLYKHFMLFSVACRLLCDRDNALRYNGYAKEYLVTFFTAARALYGPKSQIINMHNLIHLADDVKNMGCDLSQFTAFPFESFLGQMKRWVRSGNAPLAQICRRLHEKSLLGQPKAAMPPEVLILKQGHVDADGNIAILKIKYREQILTIKSPQNIVLLQDKKILKIERMYAQMLDTDDIYIEGKIWATKQPLFVYPLNSKHLHMWQLQLGPSEITVTHSIHFVARKALLLRTDSETESNERVFFMPLLHE